MFQVCCTILNLELVAQDREDEEREFSLEEIVWDEDLEDSDNNEDGYVEEEDDLPRQDDEDYAEDALPPLARNALHNEDGEGSLADSVDTVGTEDEDEDGILQPIGMESMGQDSSIEERGEMDVPHQSANSPTPLIARRNRCSTPEM